MMLAAAVCAALLCSKGVDSEGPPFDYIRPVKGGRYLFVMLVPKEWRRFSHDYEVFADASGFKMARRDGALYKTYPVSGLYPSKGPRKPLWTVDWYSVDVRACSDGVHLVRFGPWPRSDDGGRTLALAFYRSGKEIKSYQVRDLVADVEKLPHSVSHYMWRGASGFDDVGKRLRVQIMTGWDGRQTAAAVFDLTTGLHIDRS